MKHFNELRTFGVEIEFKGDRIAVADYMNAHGVDCHIEGYNHFTRNYWKIVTDASCEFELVSPPICGQEGLEQLRVACEALEAAGARVDRTCGLHVHHNANDLDVKAFANIFALYIKNEDVIDSMMPVSRRESNNQYCRSLGLSPAQKQRKLDQLKNVKSVREIVNEVYCSRYYKVNAEAYLRHGTIEFRQHSGTIDFAKISNWIIFTQRIVERAKEGRVNYTYTEVKRELKLLSLQKMLGILASSGADETLQEMNKFYVARIKQLNVA